MNIKALFIIALILFLVPIFMGKVDTAQITLLFKNPSQLTDVRVLKLVFGDLISGVIGYYRGLGEDLFKKIFGRAKEELQKKELQINIK